MRNGRENGINGVEFGNISTENGIEVNGIEDNVIHFEDFKHQNGIEDEIEDCPDLEVIDENHDEMNLQNEFDDDSLPYDTNGNFFIRKDTLFWDSSFVQNLARTIAVAYKDGSQNRPGVIMHGLYFGSLDD